MTAGSHQRRTAESATEAIVAAALTSVASAFPADSKVAVETGHGIGAAMLQYCATLMRPTTAPPFVAIVKPPAVGPCLGPAWHSRQGRTRVLLTPTTQPYSAMAEAAAEAGCEVLLLGDLPGQGTGAHAHAPDRDFPESRTTSGLHIRQPFLSEEFTQALGTGDTWPNLLSDCLAELARRIFPQPTAGASA